MTGQKSPTIFGGILFALCAGLVSFPGLYGLGMFFPLALVIRAWILVLYGGYLVYLLRARRLRLGVVSLVAVNVLLGGLLAIFPSTTSFFVAAVIALMMVSRSLIFHRSLLSWLLDGGVASIGFYIGSLFFLRTFSLPVAVWVFFLFQAGFVLLPCVLKETAAEKVEAPPDPFVRSYRNAEAAIERIVQIN